ncbi:MacS family sensor histidine kinase [Streptomyces polygonati]|uniref:MacS family sensor histidine kinase n=1 Tax=Streptomyces polygonati TaxID=1617087 RepID=A0ABV8HEG6_9ACTN
MAVRMSVEQPLWRALLAYRVLTCGYAIAIYVHSYDRLRHPLPGGIYMAVLAVWTLATLGRVRNAERCTPGFLALDLGLAISGILLTGLVDAPGRIASGAFTLPSIWTAGSVLAFAVKGGWRWAALASSLVAAADLVERGTPSRDTLHNLVLVWIASIAIGYVVEVARASERTLARALRIEAATRERERLARDIHDGVLQVLAMVQRRGKQAGGEAAELGRLAGEQEAALRTLISSAPAATAPDDDTADPLGQGPQDLRALLTAHLTARDTLSAPGTPVLLDPDAAAEMTAAVAAALDNVRTHAGEEARAWILVEDEPDAVLVTVRDDGPGIPAGRLAAAEREGRLGVAQSIRGRLRDLGGTAELFSLPGQGTEVELRLPSSARRHSASAAASGASPAGTAESAPERVSAAPPGREHLAARAATGAQALPDATTEAKGGSTR